MTAKEYFQSLGFSIEDIEFITQRMTIKDVEIIAQRIKDYKNELNISEEELYSMITRYPSLLNVNPTSENHKSAKERLKTYAEALGLPIEKTREIIKRCPALLGRKTTKTVKINSVDNETNLTTETSEENVIKYRIKCYAKLLKTDEATISRMAKKFPVLLNLDITEQEDCSVAKKFRELSDVFKLSEDEISKMVISFPSLLSHTPTSSCEDYQSNNKNNEHPTSITDKIKEYSKILNISKDTVIKLIRSCPNIIGFDVYSENPGSVKRKIEEYKELLNATYQEVCEFIKCQPVSLTYDTTITKEDNEERQDHAQKNKKNTSVQFKIKEYAKLLNTDIATVQKMIKEKPALLGLDLSPTSKTGIPTKIKSLLSFTTIDNIINNPILLTFPAKSVKLRYLLLSTTLGKEELENNYNLLIRSEKSIWSRIKFLEGKPRSIGRLIYSNSTFKKIYNITPEELEELYPLKHEDILDLQDKYFKLYGEKLTLNEDELEQYL